MRYDVKRFIKILWGVPSAGPVKSGPNAVYPARIVSAILDQKSRSNTLAVNGCDTGCSVSAKFHKVYVYDVSWSHRKTILQLLTPFSFLDL